MSFFDADTFLRNRHAQQIKHPSDSNTDVGCQLGLTAPHLQ